MSLVVTTQPTAEPVSVAEVRDHLNLLNTEHDPYLTSLIKAARRNCEKFCRQTAMTTTYRAVFPYWPSDGVICLPKPPLQSITSVNYIDSDGNSQLLATTEYVVDADSMPGRFIRGYEKTLPIVRTAGTAAPITIVYVGGYTTADLVPEDFRHAMLMLIGHWWMVREAAAQVRFTEVPHAVEDLLSGVWHGDYP